MDYELEKYLMSVCDYIGENFNEAAAQALNDRIDDIFKESQNSEKII